MSSRPITGWRDATITDVKNFVMKSKGDKKFIKFILEVEDSAGNFIASCLCPPTIVPGKALYRWVRLCNIPLAEIDNTIKPSSFKGKRLKVKVSQNGVFYNVSDLKVSGTPVAEKI